jgi:Fe-S cluster biogenesis protein NfuA
MFIQTEETPNPATLKFIPGCTVLPEGTADFRDATAATASPLASALMKIAGIQGVFFGKDFITITKNNEKEWASLKAPLLTAIMEHFTLGLPVMKADFAPATTDTAVSENATPDSATVQQIKELLDIKIRPAVAQDGGDITFHDYTDGIVYLQLKGSCAGCPSSSATLKAGVENMLKHYIPDIKEVRQVRL